MLAVELADGLVSGFVFELLWREVMGVLGGFSDGLEVEGCNPSMLGTLGIVSLVGGGLDRGGFEGKLLVGRMVEGELLGIGVAGVEFCPLLDGL